MDANRLLAIASKSKYLRAIDIEEPTLFTISNVTIDTLKVRNTESERGVVWFEEDERGLVLNVSLTEILMDLFGSETDRWKGKRVRLFNDRRVKFKGEAVGGIRVKSSPDIERDMVIHTGGNAFSSDVEYRIRAEGRGRGPLERSLVAEGLTLADFDTWARAHGKGTSGALDARKQEAAAGWIADGGHRAIRAAIGSKPTDSTENFEDPMAV